MVYYPPARQHFLNFEQTSSNYGFHLAPQFAFICYLIHHFFVWVASAIEAFKSREVIHPSFMQKMTGSERQFSNLRWRPTAAAVQKALIDIEIWGLCYLWEQRFTIVSLQKCLIRKEAAYVDCWAIFALTSCKCQRHLTVFMLQIDVSRCV